MKSYCGTPCYLAPEVSKGNGYSRAVDLWSVGVMLHLFVTRRLPEAELKPGELEKTVPAAAGDLIRSLLAHDPLVRITAKEVGAHRC